MPLVHIVICVLPSGNKRITYETSDIDVLKDDFQYCFKLAEAEVNTLITTGQYVNSVTKEQYFYHCFSWDKL